MRSRPAGSNHGTASAKTSCCSANVRSSPFPIVSGVYSASVANGGSNARRRAASACSCAGVTHGAFAAAARAASCRRSSGSNAAWNAVTSSRNVRFALFVERSIHCATLPTMWSYTVSFTDAFAATCAPSTQSDSASPRRTTARWCQRPSATDAPPDSVVRASVVPNFPSGVRNTDIFGL